MLELVQRLHAERGLTVVMVLHDLNQAARYTDRLVVVNAGRIVADGPSNTVVTPELLRDVFHVEARLVPPEVGLAPQYLYDRPTPGEA